MGAQSVAQHSRAKLVLAMVACTLCTWAMMGDTAVITAGNDIFENFREADPLVLNFILSGPALIQVIMGPITGKLLNHVTPKVTLLIGFGAFGIGGILGAVVDNVFYVAAMRAVAGIGMGMVNVSSLTLISELFESEAQRGTMIGLWNAGMSIIGAVISFWAGMLVLQGWEAVFRVYWVAIPIWIFVMLVVPNVGKRPSEGAPASPEDGTCDAAVSADQSAVTPWKTVVLSLVAYFVSMALFCVMYYCTSIYVAETGLGDGSVAGLLTASISLGTLAGCLVFGPFYKVAKRWVPTVFWVLLIAGYLALYFCHVVAVAVAACAVLGVVNAFVMNHYQTRLSVLPALRQRSFVIGLAAMVLGLSMFLSTYLVTFLQAVTGVSSFVGIMPTILALGVVGLLASLVVALRVRKDAAE